MDLNRQQCPNPFDYLPERPEFIVLSLAFAHGEELCKSARFDDKAIRGGNQSPDLSWSAFPRETKSFAVTCFDPDAPSVSGFWHWIVLGISNETTHLEAGAGSVKEDLLPKGAFHIRNDAGVFGYMGAAPPPKEPFAHRYFFTVYALDVDVDNIDIGKDVTATRAGSWINRHTIARAFLQGHFKN